MTGCRGRMPLQGEPDCVCWGTVAILCIIIWEYLGSVLQHRAQ